jgi:OOP family OmpA-OmpF porin
LVLAPSAQAQWMALKQDTGLYIGGAVGQARDKEFCGDATSIGFTGCDDKDVAWKLQGGYQFNRNAAVEVGYVNFGKFKATAPGVSGEVEAWAIELLGVLSIPLTREFSVYGKAGFFRWDADAKVTGGGLLLTGSDNGTDFTFGLGLGYAFTPNLGARLEWQRYADVDVNIASLGLVYKFR